MFLSCQELSKTLAVTVSSSSPGNGRPGALGSRRAGLVVWDWDERCGMVTVLLRLLEHVVSLSLD